MLTKDMTWEEMTWEDAYAYLSKHRDAPDVKITCTAITRMGKPFDAKHVEQAAPLVATYLAHANFLVRYQAVWFLGSWAKLQDYLPEVIRAAQTDEEVDNRAFAARCAGSILESNPNANAVKILLQMALSAGEDADVRSAAYGSLLYAFYGKKAWARAKEFEPIGTKSVENFDTDWLLSLKPWIQSLEEAKALQL